MGVSSPQSLAVTGYLSVRSWAEATFSMLARSGNHPEADIKLRLALRAATDPQPTYTISATRNCLQHGYKVFADHIELGEKLSGIVPNLRWRL